MAGARTLPLEETLADTLAWERTRPAGRERHAGLTPDEERALLAELTPDGHAGSARDPDVPGS